VLTMTSCKHQTNVGFHVCLMLRLPVEIHSCEVHSIAGIREDCVGQLEQLVQVALLIPDVEG